MISITDNNEVFIVGGDDNKIHIYLNTGDNFVNDDALIDSIDDINIADITGDGKWILNIDESGVVLVYKFNFKIHKYELYQTITANDGSLETTAGAITDDHMWMVFGNSNGYVYIYTFNEN